MTKLIFRGTGDSQGVPRVYCDCGICAGARSPQGINRRLRPSLQMSNEETGTTWIDCGPDWSKQMELAGLRGIDRLLLTHGHFDHIGGLVEWYDVCRWTERRGEVYCPAEVIPEIHARFPWLTSRMAFIAIDEGLRIGEWTVRAWRVNHGKNGYSYAFRFDSMESGFKWVYCPDSIDLTEQQQEPLREVDLLILGTSFYKEPYARESRSLYDVTEAIEHAAKWKPGRMLLTHLSHDIDIRERRALPEYIEYAHEGLAIHV
ncbi:MBL fold metallo-hydrolase [Paenibacillus sp. HB172176]|uniref:MBL fold metallo-hydrolase n=1 Tax=Paenibacillus sp. HB172176 TaxID=2493690 RepID=UPI00143A7334|nr:MBL fold metallo-hydrolase [Paenibacillus sp. HB172176]